MTSVKYLYINGLSTGKASLKEKIALWWWRRTGLNICHAHINWFDGHTFAEKLQYVKEIAEGLFASGADRVVLLGASAGGSLAINAFYELHNKHVYAVNMHGRLKVGDYSKGSWYSLERRAYIGTSRSSQSFYDSVCYCEEKVIPNLTPTDKKRLLILTQLTDMIAPLKTMPIPGVRQHRSWVLGHTGGFVAHMIGDRYLIARFIAIK